MAVSMNESEWVSRANAIDVVVLDVDGVLTDGVIALDDNGVETKNFFVRDGGAIVLWRRAGHRAAILSGRSARCVEHRARELGIAPVIQGSIDKGPRFAALLDELAIEPKQVCYIGDDLADLPVLTWPGLGLAACPADAVPEVLATVHFICAAHGGRGAVRGLIEAILRAQGSWDQLVAGNRK